jgi:hypothetical protein
MRKLTSAKIFFCLAALLFVAKPFLGFSIFSRVHPPAVENIFVKAFTKRKVETHDSNKRSAEAIQKKLGDAAQQFSLLIFALLSIILPLVLLSSLIIPVQRGPVFSLAPSQPSWLLNGKLII